MMSISANRSSSALDARAMDTLERADLRIRSRRLAGGCRAFRANSPPASWMRASAAEQLRPLRALVSSDVLDALGLRVLVADHEIFCLTRELEEASRRISDLVQAVKIVFLHGPEPGRRSRRRAGHRRDAPNVPAPAQAWRPGLAAVRAEPAAHPRQWQRAESDLDQSHRQRNRRDGDASRRASPRCSCKNLRWSPAAFWSRSATTVREYPRTCKAASSSRSSPPSRSAKAPASASTSCSASFGITRVRSAWSRSPAERCFKCASRCREFPRCR